MSEEEAQVRASTSRALELLRGSKKDHKKGVTALIKLTGKKEYAQLACERWVSEGGANMTIEFLDNAELEDENLHDLLEDHIKLLCNVVRVEKFIPALVNLLVVEALMRILMWCPVGSIIQRTLKLIGLISVDSSAMKELIATNAISEIMNHVSIKDDVFLTSVLPRLLKDEHMVSLFCDHGGVSFLQGVLVFEDESTPQALAGAIAAIGMIAKTPKMLSRLIAEDEFVTCFVTLLSNTSLAAKVKLHVVKTLYLLAQDVTGLSLVSSAVLPLMELIEDRSQETLPAAVAAFDVLALLCNTREAINEVDQYGGVEFIEYILVFLKSAKSAVVEPACGLLHVLALGAFREKIVEGMEKYVAEDVPCKEIVGFTVDLIVGAKNRRVTNTKATAAAADNHEDLGVVERPQRKQTREAQTARQGGKRANIIKEILSTERTYSVSLFSVIKCFMDPMKKMTGGSKPMVTAHDLEQIFGNLEEIYNLHKNFLKKLDQKIKANPQANVAELFMDLADAIVPAYRPYYISYPKAIALLDMKEKKTKGFRQMCTDLTKKIVRGGLSLENYLIMPIQRVPRYALLLRELDKATVDVHPEKEAIKKAAVKMEEKIALLDSAEESDPTPPPLAAAAASRKSIMKKPNGTTDGRRSTSAVANGEKRRISFKAPTTPKAATLSGASGAAAAKAVRSPELLIYSDEPVRQPMAVEPVINPILADGMVMEQLMSGQFVYRKFILLRDKLVVMTSSKGQRNGTNVPAQVHSFPLPFLHMEKLDGDGGSLLKMRDTRDSDENGTLFTCETEREVNEWLDVIFSAIYSD